MTGTSMLVVAALLAIWTEMVMVMVMVMAALLAIWTEMMIFLMICVNKSTPVSWLTS